VLKWFKKGLAWRWRMATRLRYLRRTFRNGDELARSYLNRTACETAVLRDGIVVRHPVGRTGLCGMILEVWHDEIYTGRFYTPAPGDVVIDAGANIGLFSLLVARRQPQCKVLAFEPFDENFRLLTENLAGAGASGVRAFSLALAGESGTASMSDVGTRSQDHQLAASPSPGTEKRSVRTCSLFEVFRMANADVIQMFKCDIEGSERELFAGADTDTLRRCQRYAIEYHDNLQPGTLDLLLRRLSPTHTLDVRPAGDGGYGMLYATIRIAEKFNGRPR